MKNHIGLFLKLHIVNDKDVIDRLQHEDNKQGYIKNLIRKDEIKNEGVCKRN